MSERKCDLNNFTMGNNFHVSALLKRSPTKKQRRASLARMTSLIIWVLQKGCSFPKVKGHSFLDTVENNDFSFLRVESERTQSSLNPDLETFCCNGVLLNGSRFGNLRKNMF